MASIRSGCGGCTTTASADSRGSLVRLPSDSRARLAWLKGSIICCSLGAASRITNGTLLTHSAAGAARKVPTAPRVPSSAATSSTAETARGSQRSGARRNSGARRRAKNPASTIGRIRLLAR